VNLVSPLSKVLGLGSAKGGTEHWWAQRLTAVALIPLGLWFAISIAALPDASYATISAWVGRPWTSILLLVLVWTVTYHSYLGVQVVVEDYVHGKSSKTVSLILVTFAHVFFGIAGAYAVLKVGFGA
jgi:succinate dehydrogenase / fumarate reductase membrane anchor subunit